MMKTIKTLILLFVILALGLTACGNQQAVETQASAPAAPALPPDSVIAEGHLKPVHAANLTFQLRGTVESVTVKIGDRVNEGDLLARLSNASQAKAQLAAANLESVQAQYDLDTLIRTGDANLAQAWIAYQDAQIIRADAQSEWDDINPIDIASRVDDQQSVVNDRKQDLEDAQDEFDRYKDLDKDNSRRKTAEDDLRSVQNDYDDAVAELEDIQRENDSVRAALDAALAKEAEARYQWDLSTDGVNNDQLALAQSRLDNAQAQVGAAQDAISNYVLTAPFDGVVADVSVGVGEQVGAESRAVSIVDESSWVVETSDVTELEVVNIQPGQPVTIIADALPDISMEGTVMAVSQSSFTQSGDVLYSVYIELTEVDSRVKWGMTVEVIFESFE
jgi:multidrug resistance efflux pump